MLNWLHSSKYASKSIGASSVATWCLLKISIAIVVALFGPLMLMLHGQKLPFHLPNRTDFYYICFATSKFIVFQIKWIRVHDRGERQNLGHDFPLHIFILDVYKYYLEISERKREREREFWEHWFFSHLIPIIRCSPATKKRIKFL